MSKLFLTRSEWSALKETYSLLEVDKSRFLAAVGLGALGLGAAVALGGSSAWLIARASQMPPVLYLEVCVVLVRLFGISKAVFRYLERLMSHRIAVGGMSTLRANVYQRLANANPAQINRLKRGDLLERMGNDVDSVGDFVVKSLLPAAIAAIVSLATVLTIGLIDLPSGVCLAGALFLSGIVGPLFSIRATRIANDAHILARTGINETAMSIVDGAAQINISGQKAQILNILAKHEAALSRAKDRSAYPAATAAALDLFSMLLAVVAAAWFGINGVGTGQVSEVMLAVLVLTPLAAFEATAPLGAAAAQLVRSAQAAERIVVLLPKTTLSPSVLQPAVSLESASVLAASELPSQSAEDPQTDQILSVKAASIGWPGYPTILRDLNFTVSSGQKIAIVGRSGIGKSTLLTTLAGIIPPQTGQVLWQEQEISQLPRIQAAAAICLITEDAHIFETSVLENLRVARGDLSTAEAKDCLEKAGLSDWLAHLPQGLETIIGSGATTISGGERRRLLLARGLAAKAPILAFDEPAEHLDPTTADQLLADLFKLAEVGKTIILATHRLTPLAAVDEVIILGQVTPRPDTLEKTDQTVKSQVVAQGTHQELLANNEQYRWSWLQEQVDVWQ